MANKLPPIPNGDVKNPTSLNLTETAEILRTKLAAKMGVNKTAVIELAIRLLAKTEGVTVERE